MTSPAQLKYLDAMGIPVWVSRDAVLEETPVEHVSKDSNTSESSNDSTSTSAQDILKNLEKQADVNTKSSDSITAQTPVPAESTIIQPSQSNQKQVNCIGETSQHTVYAHGSVQAEWLVIGESPEYISNHLNQPFAGDAGVLLSNMLKAVGVKNPHEDAYQINILKRTQVADKNEQSSIKLNSFLTKTIREIEPKILLIVGQLAAQNLLQSKDPLARLRGKAQKLAGFEFPVVVTYYPDYLLNKPLDKRKAWEDLKRAMSLLS